MLKLITAVRELTGWMELAYAYFVFPKINNGGGGGEIMLTTP
jgi:hypothetical protein